MDRRQLLEKLEQMKKEFAKKEKKLEKASRAARVKAHVKKKIQELNAQTDNQAPFGTATTTSASGTSDHGSSGPTCQASSDSCQSLPPQGKILGQYGDSASSAISAVECDSKSPTISPYSFCHTQDGGTDVQPQKVTEKDTEAFLLTTALQISEVHTTLNSAGDAQVCTKAVNPLGLTPPSTQLRRGQCGHKRVNPFKQLEEDSEEVVKGHLVTENEQLTGCPDLQKESEVTVKVPILPDSTKHSKHSHNAAKHQDHCHSMGLNFETDSLAITPSFRGTAYSDVTQNELPLPASGLMLEPDTENFTLSLTSRTETGAETPSLNLHSHTETKRDENEGSIGRSFSVSHFSEPVHASQNPKNEAYKLNYGQASSDQNVDDLGNVGENQEKDSNAAVIQGSSVLHAPELASPGVQKNDAPRDQTAEDQKKTLNIKSGSETDSIVLDTSTYSSQEIRNKTECPSSKEKLMTCCQNSEDETEKLSDSHTPEPELDSKCGSEKVQGHGDARVRDAHETCDTDNTCSRKAECIPFQTLPFGSSYLSQSTSAHSCRSGLRELTSFANETEKMTSQSSASAAETQSPKSDLTSRTKSSETQSSRADLDFDQYSEYTELDVIPYSQFELREDFLSESSQSFELTCSQGRSRRRHSAPLVQRRSPRISSMDFSASINFLTSQRSFRSNRSPGAVTDSLLKMVRKQRKSKNVLLLSSAFQYLIDEARRDKTFKEFQLPPDIADLVCDGSNRESTTMKVDHAEQSESSVNNEQRKRDTHSTDESAVDGSGASSTASVASTAGKQKFNSDPKMLTESQIMVIPETEFISELENQSGRWWYEGSDASVVECDDANKHTKLKSAESPPYVSSAACESSHSQQSQKISTTDSSESTDKPRNRKMSLSCMGRKSRAKTKDDATKTAGGKEKTVLKSSDNQQLLSQDQKAGACRDQTGDNLEQLPSTPRTPSRTEIEERESVDSPTLFTSQPPGWDVKRVAESIATISESQQTHRSEKKTAGESTAALGDSEQTHHIDNQAKGVGNVAVTPKHKQEPLRQDRKDKRGEEERDKSNAVFTPSKGGSAKDQTSFSSWLSYSGCAESGCKEPVIAVVTGVSSGTENTPYILSVQSSLLTLWTQDDTFAWTAELHWYLPQDSQAEGACRIPSDRGELTVLVWGSCAELGTPFLTVFVFHWETQHTLRFALPLASPVIPHRMFCHGLPTTTSTAVVFAADKAYTRGRTCMLDTSQGSVTGGTEMEMVEARLVDLRLVEDLADAALGFSDEQKFLLWNVKKGSLLLTLTLPADLPPLSRVFSSFFLKGYLLQYALSAEDTPVPCLVAVNPTVGKGTVLRRYQRGTKQEWQQVWVHQDIVLASTVQGTLHIWDASSARSVASLESKPGKTDCVSVVNSGKSRWLVTGHGTGCLHIYSVK